NDINDSDVVIGESTIEGDQFSHAFMWIAGSITNLGTLGGSNSSAFAINNAGQVIGTSDTPNDASHGFIYSGGVMTDLGTLGGDSTTPLAINSGGQVVGISDRASGGPHAFLWQNGTMIDLNKVLPANSGW